MKNSEIIVFATTLVICYLLYTAEAHWFWYLFVLALAGAVAMSSKESEKVAESKKADMEELQSQGIEVERFIPLGNYIGGHPDLNHFLSDVRALSNGNRLELYATIKDSATQNVKTSRQADIITISISNITIEDRTAIEKRISVGRLILFGPLALAMRKTQKTEVAFLCISWNDGKFSHDTFFSLSNLEKANIARNMLIKECRQIMNTAQ